MIKILLLDDSPDKVRKIKNVILENIDIKDGDIVLTVCSKEARLKLYKTEFDLLIIDLLIPENFGDEVSPEESLSLLHDIKNDDKMNKPLNIIGITAFDNEAKKYDKNFSYDNWHLILYSESSHTWEEQLRNTIKYIIDTKKCNTPNTQYIYDIGIVCALNSPEFEQVLKLSHEWKPLIKKNSSVEFIETTFQRNKKTLRVVAASINRMGMVPVSVLATQMIEFFRPRYIAMTGIAAGIDNQVGLGDIMVAEYSWDYNSGKIETDENGGMAFYVDLRQEKMDEDLYNSMNALKNDTSFLGQLYSKYSGKKPKNILEIKIGHIASGAAVIANKSVIEGIKEHSRKLIGVEMEAYGLFYAAHNASNPKPKPLVIKSVCDFADEKKNDDIQDYAAYTSAQVLYEFALRHL